MKYLTFLLSLLLSVSLLVSSLAAEEVWRCPNGTYTNNPRVSSNCTPVDVSTLCGRKNRYITPARKQFFNKDELCGYDAQSVDKPASKKKKTDTSPSSLGCFFSGLLSGKVAFRCSND